MATAMTNCEFVTDKMIQGYHIFRILWHAVSGKSLQCVHEVGNVEDIHIFMYTVAVYRGNTVVGHLTQKNLRI